MKFIVICHIRNVEFTSLALPQPEANDLYAYLKELNNDYTEITNVWMTPDYEYTHLAPVSGEFVIAGSMSGRVSSDHPNFRLVDRRSGARDEKQCIDVCKPKPGTACAMSAHWCTLQAPHEGTPHLFPCDGEAQ